MRDTSGDDHINAMSGTRPNVVVVGAGFGGIEAARALRRAPVNLTVVDRQNHHCFQPLLYQVATAALSPADIAWPIRHILRGQDNATVLLAEVTGVDTAARRILLSGADPLPYDQLVIATGSIHSYFGHDEWGEFAPGLKRIVDATRIRRSILLAFERAELAHDPAEQQRLLTFVLVGGGATGVEMAGAIAEIARLTLARDFRRIDPRSLTKRMLENLAAAGAFDELDRERARVFASMEAVMALAQRSEAERAGGQHDMFGAAATPVADRTTLQAGILVAQTAWDLFADPGLVAAAWRDFGPRSEARRRPRPMCR